ncbi:MAG: hypothetical protein AMXMBFR82_00590 [Candidatus Hydrogenedentota bacterium]
MRIRSSHVIAGTLVLIGGFFLVAYIRTSGATKLDGDSRDFLEEVSALRESGQGSSSHDGLIAGGGANTPGAAKIEVETTDFNMGVVDNTKPTTATMAVYNRGDAPLKILDIRTTCGCTQGQMTKNVTGENGKAETVIPPNAKMDMTITLDPFRVPGFHSRKVLTLMSSDPVTPSLEVAVEAQVLPEFTMEPESLELGTIQNGESTEARVVLREANATDLEVTEVRPGRNATRKSGPEDTDVDSGEIQYTLDLKERPQSEWADPERKEWEIVVKFAPDLPVGTFSDSFYILTNTKRVDRFAYRVSANVESFFSVTPTMLSVRNAVDPGSSQIATAVVSSETDFSLDDVEVTGEAFSVAVRDGDKPNTKFLDLGVRPDAGPGLKNESVSFTVRSGDKAVKHTMRAFASVTG